MKRMTVKYENDTEVVIELLDTPYVRYFLENWERLKEFPIKQECSGYNMVDTVAKHLTEKERDDKAKEYGDVLTALFTEIKDKWDVEFPERMHPNMTSKELDHIHRCFTTGVMTLCDRGFAWSFPEMTLEEKLKAKDSRVEWCYDVADGEVGDTSWDWQNWAVGVEPRFERPPRGGSFLGYDKLPNSKLIDNIKWGDSGYDRFNDILHGINHYVHLYENAYKVTANSKIGQEIVGDKQAVQVMRQYYDRGQQMAGKELRTVDFFHRRWQNECSFDTHDVWLCKDILGRDYLDAWIHHDDPTHPDVCNICMRHSPNIIMDPANIHNELLTSEPMRQWFDEYGIPFEEKLLANIPLGNIVNGWSIEEHSKEWPNPQAVEWLLV
jgi:hypothetical protein